MNVLLSISLKMVIQEESLTRPYSLKNSNSEMVIAQIYVDDILFGGMSQTMVEHFVQHMQSEFKMSMVEELTYFLGFLIN